MKILFLDDAPWRHDLVKARMEGPDSKIAGTEVVHVWTVDECVEALQNQGPFDLVMLDHDLNDFIEVTGKQSQFIEMYGARDLTGRDVTRWMARTLANLDPKPEVIVHSWNHHGAVGMVKDLQEVGFKVKWELFNGGTAPGDDDFDQGG